jgi:hypothetical protein
MAKAYCREVVRILRTLKAKRDMSVNEARLIVSIEDPRTREQRQLGIEVRVQQLCCELRTDTTHFARHLLTLRLRMQQLRFRPSSSHGLLGLGNNLHGKRATWGWAPATVHAAHCCVWLAVQDERGVSRDEMAAALLEVAEGRVPKDRLALKCLLEDMQVWQIAQQPAPACNHDGCVSQPVHMSRLGNRGRDTVALARQQVVA